MWNTSIICFSIFRLYDYANKISIPFSSLPCVGYIDKRELPKLFNGNVQLAGTTAGAAFLRRSVHRNIYQSANCSSKLLKSLLHQTYFDQTNYI